MSEEVKLSHRSRKRLREVKRKARPGLFNAFSCHHQWKMKIICLLCEQEMESIHFQSNFSE